MRLLSIAALQIAPIKGDPEATWVDFERRVTTLQESLNGLQLMIAPELHLAAIGGFFDEQPGDAQRLAGTIPGALTDRQQPLGDCCVAYNTAVAISPEGELVVAYRKCFPWQPYETTVPGTRLATFEIPGVGTIGLAICHDGAFPEVFRALAWMGAEVVDSF